MDAKGRIKLELEHAAFMLEKETEKVLSRKGKEKHAEQMHFWDGKRKGLLLALNLLAKY